jgi:hypothetical protein
MAFDNFIGWTQQDKIAMLRGIQEAMLTGQEVRVQTAHGVLTEFNISQTNIEQMLRKLEESIANSPDYNPGDPIQLACRNNQRAGITRPNFTR